MANDFYKFKFLNQPITDENLDSTIEHMNDVIYSYFKQSYGTVNNANHSNLMSSYKARSIQRTEKRIEGLKARKADTVEIKFVANLLRKKLQKTEFTCLHSGHHGNTVHHDQFIGKNFGGYVKTFRKQETNTSPSFNKDTFTQFFTDLFACLSPGKFFSIPNWIPSFCIPKVSLTLALLPINRSQMLCIK